MNSNPSVEVIRPVKEPGQSNERIAKPGSTTNNISTLQPSLGMNVECPKTGVAASESRSSVESTWLPGMPSFLPVDGRKAGEQHVATVHNQKPEASTTSLTTGSRGKRSLNENRPSLDSLEAWVPGAPSIEQGSFNEKPLSYFERLYSYAEKIDEVHFMEYRHLQRINIFHLQNRLAKLKNECGAHQEVSEEVLCTLKNALRDYTTAIRDYIYLRDMNDLHNAEAEARRSNLSSTFPEIAFLPSDPFNSRYCTLANKEGPPTDALRDFLKAHLPKRMAYTDIEIAKNSDAYLEGKPPNSISPQVDRFARLLIALAGGAWLIVPMIVMSLPDVDRNKGLITASIATTLFALTMAFIIRANNPDTLVSTATYAAVLVVFVGTST